MPRESERADAPGRWLENAVADLALAKAPLPLGGIYEHLCFHAQQAAEKSLKAVLLSRGMQFPFTHSIQALLDLLPTDLDVDSQVYQAVDLSPYAVLTRYPGEYEPVTEEAYREAIHVADVVVSWAKRLLAH